MARYTASVETPRTRREVFAYLSDFKPKAGAPRPGSPGGAFVPGGATVGSVESYEQRRGTRLGALRRGSR